MPQSKKPIFRSTPDHKSDDKKRNRILSIIKAFLFNKLSLKPRYVAFFLIALVLTSVVYLTEKNADLFKASILQEADLPEFDGTALPIDVTLNLEGWTHHKEDHYNEVPKHLFRPAPAYDLDILEGEPAVWGVHSDEYYITKRFFGVVYMASYGNHHQEYSGTHSAVDVIANKGTPANSIANGVVLKAEQSDSGYGNHIVIQHKVPLDGKTTTILSSYSHLERMDKKVGDVVSKGEQIGTVGDTGSGTTNHLHFQIEKERPAGWYPGWFSNQSEGIKYTINPWEFVEEHLDHTPSSNRNQLNSTSQTNTNQQPEPEDAPVTDSDSTEETAPQPSELESTKDSDVVSVIEIIEDEQSSDSSNAEEPIVDIATAPLDETPNNNERVSDNLTFHFKEGSSTSMVGSTVKIVVQDRFNQLLKVPDSERIEISLKGDIGEIIKAPRTKADFEDGEAEIIVRGREKGTDEVLIGKHSKEVHFLDEIQLMARLKFDHDGSYQPGISETVRLQAADLEWKDTPVVSFSGTVDLKVAQGDEDLVSITPNQLAFGDFIDGSAKVAVKVMDDAAGPVVIEAYNGRLFYGESDPILPKKVDTVFPDVPPTDQDFEAIMALYEREVIKGYPTGEFGGGRQVNRVEATEIVMNAFKDDSPAPANVNLPWPDTDNYAWYAVNLQDAFNHGVIDGHPTGFFEPGAGVNTVQLAKMLVEKSGIKIEEVPTGNQHPNIDPEAWYAPYLYTALELDALPELDHRFYRLDHPLNRAMVARITYRFIEALEL